MEKLNKRLHGTLMSFLAVFKHLFQKSQILLGAFKNLTENVFGQLQKFTIE